MTNPKPETADSVAAKINASASSGLTFNAADHLKQAEPPVKTPLPVPLAKALGQST